MADLLAVIDTEEGQQLDRKSLRVVQGQSTDFEELAKDCVCFANGSGGQLLIGIEDDASLPPPQQRIEARVLDRIRKRIGELTVNVTVIPEIQTAANGGQLIGGEEAEHVLLAARSVEVVVGEIERARDARILAAGFV